MPVYEYLEANGSTTTRVLPVEERDAFPNRITVPRSIVFVGSTQDPTISANRIREGYKKLEERGVKLKTSKRDFDRAWGSHDTKSAFRSGKPVNVT